MKRRTYICAGGALLFIYNLPGMASSLEIMNLAENSSKVEVFGKFEIAFDLSREYQNPYDPAEIDVAAVFKSPAGEEMKITGFFYQPCAAPAEGNPWPLPEGKPVWKCRFTPNSAGIWSYRLEARDRDGAAPALEGKFRASAVGNPGFVRRSAHDIRYLVRDDERVHFAVGENLGWGGGRDPLVDFLGWIDKLADSGGNFIRVWMAPWWTDVEWKETGLGNYAKRQDRAAGLDLIFERCEKRGVTIMLCLINHGKFSSKTNPNWDDSPYNHKNGGPLTKPEGVWTNKQTREFMARKWRYIVARWGYSTALHSWEFWNEMEWVDDFKNRIGEAAAWHRDATKILSDLDPYGHLITTSFAQHPGPSEVWEAGSEITQTHSYKSPDLAATAREYALDMIKRHRMPYLLGEFGIDWDWDDQERWEKTDPDGLALHNAHWGSLMAGAAGSGLSWWWDTYVDPRNLYYRFTGVAEFVKGEDLDRCNYKATEPEASSPELRVYALESPERVLGWIQCRANTWKRRNDGEKCPVVKGAALTLSGLVPGDYWLEWWDPVKGKLERTKNVRVKDAPIAIEIPDLDSAIPDRAFKLSAKSRKAGSGK